MRSRCLLLFLLWVWGASVGCAKPVVTEAERIVTEWLAAYRALGIPDKDVCKPVSVTVDDRARTIVVVADNVFASQQFTPDVVAYIYRGLQTALGAKYENYRLSVRTKLYPIEQLITFSDYKSEARRQFKQHYTGTPWVTNVSRPYTFKYGLGGQHIALWASHGRFWKSRLQSWLWQRPCLYTTAEDILTPGVVNSLLIPMLEHSGAIVFTPRERDWQRHEALADNDTGGYREHGSTWSDGGQGFGCPLGKTLGNGENPFAMGTVRVSATIRNEQKSSLAVWTPRVLVAGDYAVYVSYKTVRGSVSDAHYTVRHSGVNTNFIVNQTMGGSTWVYLGTFHFTPNAPDDNCVILSNYSSSDGVVTADAVRFGGGMGNIDRGGGVSGMPRYFEGARYSMQWAGMPASVYSDKGEDYADDINCRSLAVNYLSGGSVYNPSQSGLGVPLELSLACHTDAGFTPDSPHGTLGINMTTHDKGTLPEGVSRLVSHDMAQVVMQQVYSDLTRTFGVWQMRQLWDRNYSECRLPAVPSMILEMLSHQSLTDMRMMHDPTFKFTLARAIYKGVLRYQARMHSMRNPVVQPLPVTALAAVAETSKHTITVSWQPVTDQLEPTATPSAYVVYVKKGADGDFDNGIYTSVPRLKITAEPGVLYSFRVSAVNAGGESMGSPVVSAMVSRERNPRRVMIVDGFQRLAGPQPVEGGFDIMADPGVPYMATPSLCGAQTDFSTGLPELNSGNELEGRVIVGNTQDVAYTHAVAMCGTPQLCISSCVRSAVEQNRVNLSDYRMVDFAMGLQRADGYSLVQTPVFTPALLEQVERATVKGTCLLISGSYIGMAEKSQPVKMKVTQASVSELFKFCYTSTLSSYNIYNITGMNTSLQLFRPFSTEGMGVPSADVIYPTGGAFACMLYQPTGATAAIAYVDNRYKTMAFGFPLESVASSTVRQQMMDAVLRFLLK